MIKKLILEAAQYSKHAILCNILENLSNVEFQAFNNFHADYLKNNFVDNIYYELPLVNGKQNVDEKSGVRYNDPHITVFYGLINECDYFPIKRNIESTVMSFNIKFGNISKFTSDEYDVIKIDIESNELHSINQYIRENYKNILTFTEYKPHMTLAYVLPGTHDHLLGECDITGKILYINYLTFSHIDNYELPISLIVKKDDIV